MRVGRVWFGQRPTPPYGSIGEIGPRVARREEVGTSHGSCSWPCLAHPSPQLPILRPTPTSKFGPVERLLTSHWDTHVGSRSKSSATPRTPVYALRLDVILLSCSPSRNNRARSNHNSSITTNPVMECAELIPGKPERGLPLIGCQFIAGHTHALLDTKSI